MQVLTDKVRLQFYVLMQFFFVYVSIPMLWAIAIMITATKQACGRLPDECDFKLEFDRDPEEEEDEEDEDDIN